MQLADCQPIPLSYHKEPVVHDDVVKQITTLIPWVLSVVIWYALSTRLRLSSESSEVTMKSFVETLGLSRSLLVVIEVENVFAVQYGCSLFVSLLTALKQGQAIVDGMFA